MPQTQYDLSRTYTVDEVLAFPEDGNRYELVDGVLLVTPGPVPIHQVALQEIFMRLWQYVLPLEQQHIVFLSPATITWGSRTLVQPDIFVAHPEEISRSWNTIKRLRLAIEIISPSNARHDRVFKRHAYKKNGVETYWIVDPYERIVEVAWAPGQEYPVMQHHEVTWRYTPDTDSLVINLDHLWEQCDKLETVNSKEKADDSHHRL